MWTDQDDTRLTTLHNELEANGFQRSKLTAAKRKELEELEQKWTDITAVIFDENFGF